MKRILKYLMCFSLLAVISISSIGCSYLIILKDKIMNEDSAVESTEESVCEHEFASREIIVEGNCTTETQSKRTCKLCGYEKITNDGYYHENLIYTDGYSASCEQAGLTPGYECQDCGYIEGMQIIEMLSHADTDNNGFCDNCPTLLVGEWNEVPVTSGTTIANKWFRFYRNNDEAMGFRYIGLKFSGYADNPENIITYDFIIGSLNSSYPNSLLFNSGPTCTIEDIDVYFYDDYVDIYFKEGEYTVTKNGSYFGKITINSLIEFSTDYHPIGETYELVKGE